MHANGLSALSADIVRPYREKPLQISLHQNPLVCDCNVRWIAELLAGGNESVRIQEGALLCRGPRGLEGAHVASLDLSQIAESCAPVLAVGSTNHTVEKKVGDDHVFECRAHGLPPPVLHWVLPDGQVLNQSSDDTRLHLRGDREACPCTPSASRMRGTTRAWPSTLWGRRWACRGCACRAWTSTCSLRGVGHLRDARVERDGAQRLPRVRDRVPARGWWGRGGTDSTSR
ncbi:leucine-rich repeat neuronal protein 2 [Caerostris extrusa]|uniref:Leucine-rich repeat neuronal protein 2 n=1 Tax=Caerostris extrusa TaxID=172846 RepID=A0AAV4XY92_CAEEX|nr:leucine-rich repeat neuronal protein 2 [Caerostris extrusa]